MRLRGFCRVLLVCALCLVLCLCTVSAATVDDVRELVGGSRKDSNYTEDEIALIIQQYRIIDEANLTAKLLDLGKSVDINSSLISEYEKCYAELESCASDFDVAFRSGAALDDVLTAKTALSSAEYTLASLRSMGYTIEIEFLPNEWSERYFEVQETIEYLTSAFDIGSVGNGITLPLDLGFVLTSPFGLRIDPFDEEYVSLHSGIDLWAPEGSVVYSIWNGVVSNVYTSESGGLTVVVSHGVDLQTEYLHLSEALVSVGDEVSQGQPIALSGNTGRSTGPHLHLAVKLDGVPVDPLYVFGSVGVRALSEYVSDNPDRYLELNPVIEGIKGSPEGESSYDGYITGVDPVSTGPEIMYPEGMVPGVASGTASGSVLGNDTGFTTEGFRTGITQWVYDPEVGWSLVVADDGAVDGTEGSEGEVYPDFEDG